MRLNNRAILPTLILTCVFLLLHSLSPVFALLLLMPVLYKLIAVCTSGKEWVWRFGVIRSELSKSMSVELGYFAFYKNPSSHKGWKFEWNLF